MAKEENLDKKEQKSDHQKMTISDSNIPLDGSHYNQLEENYISRFGEATCLQGTPVWNMPILFPTECICPQLADTPPLQYQYYGCSSNSSETQMPDACADECQILSNQETCNALTWNYHKQAKHMKHASHDGKSCSQQDTLNLTFPASLCGRLIGKHGRNINALMRQTGTCLSLTEPKSNSHLPILRISGEQEHVKKARQLIEERFANLNLTEIGEWRALPLLQNLDSNVEVRQLLLKRDETDVIISNIINVGHLFLQMISVSTKPLCESLQTRMAKCYEATGIPKMEHCPVIGTYCVVKTDNGWFRAQVIRIFQTTEVEVLLVDFGTTAIVQTTSLWKIRSDLLEIPFQAIECCLYNVIPQKGEVVFSLDALSLLQELTAGKVLQAVPRKVQESIPFVELYVEHENHVISVNQHLVESGLVESGMMSWSQYSP